MYESLNNFLQCHFVETKVYNIHSSKISIICWEYYLLQKLPTLWYTVFIWLLVNVHKQHLQQQLPAWVEIILRQQQWGNIFSTNTVYSGWQLISPMGISSMVTSSNAMSWYKTSYLEACWSFTHRSNGIKLRGGTTDKKLLVTLSITMTS